MLYVNSALYSTKQFHSAVQDKELKFRLQRAYIALLVLCGFDALPQEHFR